MPRKITPDQHRILTETYGRNASVKAAAEAAFVSRPTAERHLKAAGFLLPNDVRVLRELEHQQYQCRDCGSTNVQVLYPADTTDT